MNSLIASVSQGLVATAVELPFSQITTAPQLTHQRDLLRRVATVDSATCGWVNGDYSELSPYITMFDHNSRQTIIDPFPCY